LMSRSEGSFFGTGGGGKGPAGGAGRIASVVVVNVAALALDGPFEALWSGAVSVVNFGTEFVVAFLDPSPG